ncbi:MAG: DUF58 domain-containing protein [Candidatus Pristimantibacillus lignocellulolyticus]|uniref:DUF58 domain-containing protein n=1 Tax=Candidatus Pristimantibacillus lignocellulolyticus TaxID=2994561 RepID=A0A9J6ZCM6_9BACL|nr:MAG: DUF58 domain-containing protein [Candidatus Pristimantibacillus lignocellulolyticus]
MVLVWFFLTALIIVIAQYYWYRRFVLRHVDYTRHFNKTVCFEGEEIEMIEQISNNKRLLIPWLYIESQLEASLKFGKSDNFAVSSGSLYQNHHSFFTLRGFTKITRKHKMTPMMRGKYKLNTVSVTSGDLMSLAKVNRSIQLNGKLTVYPKPMAIPLDNIPYHSWQGDVSVKRYILPDPFVVAGTRQYEAGDTFKQINWKATARAGSLQVHQYDFTANRKLMVVLNVDDREGMWRVVSNPSMIEDGIRYVAGITEEVIKQGMQAGFATNMRTADQTNSLYIEPNSGENHWLSMLDVMATLELERTESFSELLDAIIASKVSYTDFLFLSSFWNEELEAQLNQLRSNNNAALCLQLSDVQNADGRETVLQEVTAG